MARDVHGHQESVARAIGDAAVEIVARGEGNRVHTDVELAPGFLDRGENGLKLAGDAHIAGQIERRVYPQVIGEGLNVLLALFVEIGHRHAGAQRAKSERAAIGD